MIIDVYAIVPPRAHSLESLIKGHNWFLNSLSRFLGDQSLSASDLLWQNPGFKVHKIENFVGSDFEFCTISLL
jgi:hypothetical protein